MTYTALPSTAIVAYLALFAAVGAAFVFVCLLLGWFLRPHSPSPQKQAIYECGEPAIGSGSVQFDLRFYVVALLFLIFEVEMVFLFPPAAIFGRAVAAERGQGSVANGQGREKREGGGEIETLKTKTQDPRPKTENPESPNPRTPNPESQAPTPKTESAYGLSSASARQLALAAMIDIGVFFAVLLVGFAFLWRRGDLDWVRAVRPPAGAVSGESFSPRLIQND